ncbi:DUF881 domain-containing protein [Ectobacillus antri]|jgi:uncharacterized protein YlxW (UPF0749 family)|uniref:DUF881 domain-containing protein n=1 Tax=Ectobacillus antri TaxID=2486280 RepID=A0ABT6H0C2_9BACI|nr:DUF881 domain-containing protein [Ectobacillus antri]MDG4655839.1 DUF881 domain-containing protein [Ectobacillus antri]MDG5752514.1 DUF881 domain-containing protein [Ectobacillus antri]
MNRKVGSFTLIAFIVGLMLAVQYKAIQQPDKQDTRSEWQLKESLKTEQELQVELLKEVRRQEERLSAYETKIAGSKEQALQQTLADLREQAGLTDITGEGIVLELRPLFTEESAVVSPQLLQRLINELNTYGASAIQVANERLVVTSAVRDVNGRVSVNNTPLPSLPFEIRVISENGQRLYDRMKVSSSFDHFAIDNIEMIMSKPPEVTVKKYDHTIRTNFMKAESEEK